MFEYFRNCSKLSPYDHWKYCREINVHVVFGSTYIIIFVVFISEAIWLLSCFNQCFFLILCIFSLCWNWQHHFLKIFCCYSAQLFLFMTLLISLRPLCVFVSNQCLHSLFWLFSDICSTFSQFLSLHSHHSVSLLSLHVS